LAPLIARVEDGKSLDVIATQLPATCSAFAFEGLAEPGAGEAFVLGAHAMRDMESFRSCAERVPDVVKQFGGRFPARSSKVTPICGNLAPGRIVITEFPTAADAVAFYVSDAYAPLLKLRLATTDARLVVLARSGALPASARTTAEDYLRSHRRARR
jgi:uncharacterized protein (DUF1330 family)